jgi:arsenate reductase (thioredoxin)
MKKIIFICTGNSCRSQMAEGLAKSMGWQAFSAGVEPTPVNPNAIAVMNEIGIDISTSESIHVDEYIEDFFDVIVTVCDHANETCPVFPNSCGKKIHHNFQDPYNAIGSSEEIINVYRKVRDQIQTWLLKFTREESLSTGKMV